MSPLELVALSLIASVAVAAVGRWVVARLDLRTDDARLRERMWAGALILPLLPPVAVGLMLLTPAPQRPALIVTPAAIQTPLSVEAATPAATSVEAPSLRLDPEVWAEIGAGVVLALAGLAGVWRCGGLMLRGRRLGRLLAQTEPASGDVSRRIDAEARALGVGAPQTRVGDTGGDVLLAGPWRPTLILPPGLERETAFDLIVRHELGHLKRGDHRGVWLEEGLMILLAFNPFIPGLRAHRAAAREEACDAMALSGAPAEARRAYARRLVEVLKTRPLETPALSFGGEQKFPTRGETDMKTPTMRRMAAILTPPAPAGRTARLGALGAGLLVLTAAGAASAAVVLQREATASLVLTEEAAPDWSKDAAWSQAALAPFYRTLWPKACGVSQNEAGVVIHLGEGCAGPGVPDARVTALAGVDPVRDPRGAFAAVEAACAAGRQVAVNWTESGAARSAETVCAATPVAPAMPKAMEIALTFEGVDGPRPGDRLAISLERIKADAYEVKTMEFDLGGASILPSEVRGLAQQELFAEGQAPKLTARLIGADGRVRAQSPDWPKPMLISRDRAIAFADLKAVTPSPTAPNVPHTAQAAQEAGRKALATAASTLTSEQEARFRRATGEDYKAMCLSGEAAEDGFCAGVMFTALDVPGSRMPVCAPIGSDGQVNAITAVNRARTVMSGTVVQPGMTARDVARLALSTAWPCRSGQAPGLTG